MILSKYSEEIILINEQRKGFIMSFKIGERVKVVKGGIFGFRYDLVGKVGKIIDARPHAAPYDYGVEFDKCIGGHTCRDLGKNGYCFWGYTDQLEAINDHNKIVIIVDGDKTIARQYDGKKVIKEAIAKCSPEDKFDFATGAKLAFERLVSEAPKKEEELKFKVGDLVRVVKKGKHFPSHIAWVNENIPNLKHKWKEDAELKDGEVGIIKAIALHDKNDPNNYYGYICAIECIGDRVFVIGFDGIEKVK